MKRIQAFVFNLSDNFSLGCNEAKLQDPFRDGSLGMGNAVFNSVQKAMEYPRGEEMSESPPWSIVAATLVSLYLVSKGTVELKPIRSFHGIQLSQST